MPVRVRRFGAKDRARKPAMVLASFRSKECPENLWKVGKGGVGGGGRTGGHALKGYKRKML